VTVVEDSHYMMVDVTDVDKAAFFRIIDDCGKYWSEEISDNDAYNRPQKPFHALFIYDERHIAPIENFMKICDGLHLNYSFE
jgi:hypothetical protein